MSYCTLLSIFALIAFSSLSAAQLTPNEAFEILVQGNQKFANDTENICYTAKERRNSLLQPHEPIAAILCCSDARVAPELIFAQPIGKLFTVELAGNVAGPLAIESLEFAVQELKVPLLVVMGHEDCGAVKAAVAVGPDYHGWLSGLINRIEPAVQSAKEAVGSSDKKKLFKTAIQDNVRVGAQTLREQSSIIAEAVNKGTLRLALGVFQLQTGRVEWLDNEQRND